MDRRAIKFKLMDGDVRCMYLLYNDLVHDYHPDNDHAKLLHEHIISMRDMWEKMYRKDQEKYTLSLPATEALAFMQTWNNAHLPFDPYTNNTILKIIGHIDKTSQLKKLRRLR